MVKYQWIAKLALLIVRPADDATDTSGPRGTYGCACAHHDGSMCAWIRYGGDGPEDPCECLCHGWPEDEDDYLG